ncbi:MAG: ribulokinase [Chitinophagaceae bacterium]|nr:MAG: ribulokinase [Chitinophagaceae bacterium]
MSPAYVIGVDYGTDSVRTVVINAANGETIASAVFEYPRWKEGLYCDPSLNQFRQHPKDYIEGLEVSIRACLDAAGDQVRNNVKAISIDTTGSTPVAVNKAGVPLALLPGFEENPNAMFVLWKDHCATAEAAKINEYAATRPVNYLKFVGGIYSSEWFWAKLLFILKTDTSVRQSCYSWVEHCDWIPFLLTGGSDVHAMKRSVCAAGHKALWAPEFGGLPPDEFLGGIDPLLQGFRARLFDDAFPADQPAGTISKEWALKLGLPDTVIVGVGAFDAHMGAVGGQIEPYHLSKVMGTSTCDMLVAPLDEMDNKLVKGICGQVNGSVIPGMTGLEAGQSAFGDTYAWFRNLLSWPLDNLLGNTTIIDKETARKLREEMRHNMIAKLSEQAAAISVREDHEMALDWFNGRRTPDANQELKAVIAGLNLGSNAPRIFFALAEATCFGAKKIVDRFIEQGVPVKGLIGLGGVARKSPFIMQMMADVMNMPLRIHNADQACASGAAMFAATAAGIYPTVEEAMHAMGAGFAETYQPDQTRAAIFDKRYQRFKQLSQVIENNIES